MVRIPIPAMAMVLLIFLVTRAQIKPAQSAIRKKLRQASPLNRALRSATISAATKPLLANWASFALLKLKKLLPIKAKIKDKPPVRPAAIHNLGNNFLGSSSVLSTCPKAKKPNMGTKKAVTLNTELGARNELNKGSVSNKNLLSPPSFLPNERIMVKMTPKPSHHFTGPLTINKPNANRNKAIAPKYPGPLVKGRPPQYIGNSISVGP